MKPRITQLLYDLDGVLANFHKGGLALFGHGPEKIVKGCGWIPDMIEITTEDFWKKVDENFWTGLEKMHDADDLFQLGRDRLRKHQIGFLTSPAKKPCNWAGKAAWIHQHYPQFARRLIVTSVKGFAAAKPHVLLLDDTQEQVDDFREHGGHAILIPRPWNAEHELSDRAVAVVRGRMEEFDFQKIQD